MRKTVRQLGIVATALIVCAGVITVAAPIAEAKTVSKGEWAKGFCSALKDWQATVSKAHGLVDDVVTNGVTSSSAAKASQKQIVSALKAAGKGSEAASKDLKAVGAPDVTGGAKISTAISTAIGNVAKIFTVAQVAVAKASTVPAKFQAKLKTISAKVDKDYSNEFADIQGLDQGSELDTALNAEPTCSFASSS
jgi:hypothetical protein